MGLPRTFVGFSSTDIKQYWMMLAWKQNEHIDFDFCDCQLENELNSGDESYIKRKCRERINMAGTYIMLIGTDTSSKHKYVRWEAEVALEKECRIIGVNLDRWRFVNQLTYPPVIKDIGAMFVSFSPHIIRHALENSKRVTFKNWQYPDHVYTNLGYTLNGNTAEWHKPLNDFFNH